MGLILVKRSCTQPNHGVVEIACSCGPMVVDGLKSMKALAICSYEIVPIDGLFPKWTLLHKLVGSIKQWINEKKEENEKLNERVLSTKETEAQV